MNIKDWFFTNYPTGVNTKMQPWGALHIATLITCIILSIIIYFAFRKKSKKAKNVLIGILIAVIIIFGVARRVINFIKAPEGITITEILKILIPRPWCAISCWVISIAAIFRKKFLYNFASITALLCAIIFFAYPGVGFKATVLFDDLYSIVTHSLLLVVSLSFMTLGYTSFRYKKFWKVLLCYVVLVGYALLQIYVLKTEADPMYFMANNEVMDIIGLEYTLYLICYIAFLFVYTNLFFIIGEIKQRKRLRRNATVRNTYNGA